MSFKMIMIAAVFIVFETWTAAAQEGTVVRPFADSEQVNRPFAVDFDVLNYFTLLEGKAAESAEIEGQVRSALYAWPKGKAAIEIRRSFERALDEAGFEILVNAEIPQFSNAEKALNALQEKNRLGERGFGYAAQQVTVFPGHYLSAKRSRDGQETVFALTISRNQPRYLMEEATSAAMAEGSVEVSAEALVGEIEEAGKAVLCGVQFDTGSAVIRPSSAGSLQTIADVLNTREGGFYIVGHTDDTGGFEMNMKLSEERAAAIVKALVEDHGIDAGRLRSGGVGPLVPLASNGNDAGRQLNRRVELVEQLQE
ncbi:OmpA family protein [Jiella mangrovi]|uniref:OmpA family protein n=1 Tax=Jiella mangrovi TaxID=2821407 RepID=A0ABS4BHB9_9HYPH|nr:OmpA family protein [Jiella mangrovi]MBP0615576.1 OmpA family protein [Jiella mangrovi]